MSKHAFRSLALINLVLFSIPYFTFLSHKSKEATILGRYSSSYFGWIIGYGGTVLLLFFITTIAWRSGQRAADQIAGFLRRVGRHRLILVLVLIIPFGLFIFILEIFERYEPVRSFPFQIAFLLILLLYGIILIVYSQEETKRVEIISVSLITLFSISLFFGLVELFLRRYPSMIPESGWIHLAGGGISLRRDLIFDEPVRLGYHFRPLIDEWTEYKQSDGDLYHRLKGKIKPISSDEDMILFQLHFLTDEIGFPNRPPTREQYDIVTTGDSFGVPGPVELTWPVILEEETGLKVLNLSIPGFGPLQEVEAVVEYGLEKDPEWIIIGYFGGNDLFDVERYEEIRASGLRWDEYIQQDAGFYRSSAAIQSIRYGIPDLVNRVVSNLNKRNRPSEESGRNIEYRWPIDFQIEERDVRMAFLPEYISVLTTSDDQIRRSRNYELVSSAFRNLQELAASGGSRLLVVYFPSKPEVYLPVIEDENVWQEILDSLPSTSLGSNGFLEFSFDTPTTRALIVENMNDQRGVLYEFATQNGIDFLDLTPVFKLKVTEGLDLYHVADTHLNQTGQDLVANLVYEYLASHD